MKRLFTLFALILIGLAPAAHAQVTSMSLMGSVQSDERQPLPGAAITVIHLPSGVRHAAASDGAGRFVIPNLMAGGPYLIRVGEGGYRSQTVENIFLETGKTASFTVTLSKIAEGNNSGKERNNRNGDKNEPTLALAPEAVVGGPVLMTTISGQNQGQGRAVASAPMSAASPAASRPAPTASSMPPAPRPAATATHSASTAAAPHMAPATAAPATAAVPRTATAAAAPRYSRYPAANRYPARRPANTPVSDPIVPGHYDVRTGNYMYETGTPTTLKLPSGGTISGVGINSTESYLHHFLSSPEMKVDTMDLTRGWYNFDRVFFEPGKATLTTESMSQLRNVATLLRAYPNARIKLGGYTDSTGTYKVNKLLSEARARTAWASLVEMGISPGRIDARGYGPRYSIAANTSIEGRAMNRRLSVKVLQK